MLKVTIKHPNGQDEATYDVATEYNRIYDTLQEYGMTRVSPFGLRVEDMRKEDAPIRLHADSDAGQGLLRIIDGKDTLYDVRILDESISDVREELRDDLEQNLIHEQYECTEDLYDDIKEMLKSLAATKETFYCPLTANICDHEYGNYYETSNDVLVDNKDAIEEAIAREQATEINMAVYVGDHAELGDKLVFAEWDVTERRGTLYGKIDCYLTEALSPEETERLKDAITGQNSDGLGEGFEQREIRTDEGDLYVSFWHSGDDYFLHTQDEMDAYLSPGNGMKFGG